MRIGLISQWYDPEPGPAALPGELARGLQARGHDVRVLTAYPNYPSGRVAPGYAVRPRSDELRDGIHVRRTAMYASHDESMARRMATYASFGVTAAALGVGALRGCDAVWVNYSPITVALPMWLSRYGLGTPQVVHVLDLWPDTILHSGLSSGRAGAVAGGAAAAWCKAMYAAAHSVAYIAPSVGALLTERGVPADKLAYVPMWADEEVFRPADDRMRAELGLSPDDVVLVYAGAMGEAQGLAGVLEAAATVNEPALQIVFAGSGITESSLRAQAAERRLANVRFIGRMPQTDMTRLLGAADASLVSLRPHPSSAITLPSKTQAALAAGRALFVSAAGDVGAIVAQHAVGVVADPSDVRSIAFGLRRLSSLGRPALAEMGRRARQLYEAEFSVARGVEQVESLLARAAKGGHRK